MTLPPYYIQEQPDVEIEGGMAWLRLRSGTGPQIVVPRSVWRRFLEVEIRRLNSFESEERAEPRVVDMVKPAASKRSKS